MLGRVDFLCDEHRLDYAVEGSDIASKAADESAAVEAAAVSGEAGEGLALE